MSNETNNSGTSETYVKAQEPLNESWFGFDLLDGVTCTEAERTMTIHEGKRLFRFRLDNAELKGNAIPFNVKEGQEWEYSKIYIPSGVDALLLISPTVYIWAKEDKASLLNDFIDRVFSSDKGVNVNSIKISNAKLAHYSVAQEEKERLLSAWIERATVLFPINEKYFEGILTDEMLYPKDVSW